MCLIVFNDLESLYTTLKDPSSKIALCTTIVTPSASDCHPLPLGRTKCPLYVPPSPQNSFGRGQWPEVWKSKPHLMQSEQIHLGLLSYPLGSYVGPCAVGLDDKRESPLAVCMDANGRSP